VKWEIAETARQDHHYLFGIQVNRDRTWPIPAGLPAKNVIRWDFDQIIALAADLDLGRLCGLLLRSIPSHASIERNTPDRTNEWLIFGLSRRR
jgi:hypothetical protein